MPNWCDNSAYFRNDDVSKIDALEKVLNEKDSTGISSNGEIFQHLRPRPVEEEENWYNWNIEHWGTKWEAGIIDWERQDDNTIWVSFDSAWSPPCALYEYLTEQGWRIEAYYHECGMAYAGQFIDGEDEYFEYDIEDLESIQNLPNELLEFTALEDRYYERQEELEAEREFEEEEAKKTEWFDGTVKPVHVGRYEAKDPKMPNWPFAEFANWDGKKWVNDAGKKIKVSQWRGLKENPDDVIDENNIDGEIEKMMNEFGFKKV